MLVLVGVHAVMAVVAPGLVRWLGRRALYVVALAPLAAFCWALAQTAPVHDRGAVTETYSWVDELGIGLDLRMATLSWLLVLLVAGIGALVLAYCVRYFPPDEIGLGRYAGVFVAFAGAMFGLVVADNLLLLYVFWELTTVFSYLLIAQDPTRRANRQAATQALIVTTLGGLAMLVGVVMLGETAGTYRWSEIVANPPTSGHLAAAVVLILVGALSKSAIFPFSFWLPAAMAAPTPVSAYLHAAAMVKAGIYLVARLAPTLGADPPWRPLLLATGVLTMLLGGWTALRQHDLKLLLAYGTVSQLGLLTAVFGGSNHDAGLAGAALLLAHALFKSTLFLVVGIIDVSTGTRDLRTLSGLGRRAPVLAAIAVLAAASMAGLPPMVGFVGKEAAFAAFLHGTGGVDLAVLAGLVIGSALTVAYTLRFLWGAFADKAAVPETPAPRPIAPDWLVWPGILAVAGLAVGAAAKPLDGTPRAVRRPVPGDRDRVPPRGVARSDRAARALGPGPGGRWRAVLLWQRLPGTVPTLPFDGGTAVPAGDERSRPRRGRGHRRHPARLAPVLPRRDPARAGRRPGRHADQRGPLARRWRAWDTSLQVVVAAGSSSRPSPRCGRCAG